MTVRWNNRYQIHVVELKNENIAKDLKVVPTFSVNVISTIEQCIVTYQNYFLEPVGIVMPVSTF